METKPTLALIPSAYKTGKVYSVLPADGVGDFDFGRSGQATRVNKDGLIETVGGNTPRLNYPMIDGVVSGCPSLLLEPQRTNLLQYSEDFSNAAWIKSNATIISNSIISPNGSLNADELQVTSSGGNIYDNVSGSGDGVFSVFAKYKDVQYIRLRSTNSYAFFDIKNGVLGGTISTIDTKIEKYPNGWYKCSVIGNNTNSLAQIFVSSDGVNTGLGNVYLWGADFQEGSYATSYIPTSGSIGTRDADACNGAGNEQVFNDSEGTFFVNFAADFNIYNSGLADRGISINDGTNSNSVKIFQATSLDNKMAYDLDTSLGANQVFNTSTQFTDITDFNKVAFTYKQNEFKIFLNGVQQGSTDTNGSVFSNGTLKGISFDYGQEGNKPFFGRVKEVKYFNSALTDAELQALTS